MSSGNIDVADVIRRLNKKLDEIEKGVEVIGGEEEKQPDINSSPEKVIMINDSRTMISKLDAIIREVADTNQRVKTSPGEEVRVQTIKDVNIVNNNLLDALKQPLVLVDTYTDDEWDSTKLSNKQRLEALTTKKTMPRQLRLLNYNIQLTFTNEEVGNGLLVAMLKDTYVNNFDTSVGWRLSKSQVGVIKEINNLIVVEALRQDPMNVSSPVITNDNLLSLEIEDICAFMKYDPSYFRTPVFVVVTEYHDSNRCTIGRFVLKNELEEGYYEELNEDIIITGTLILKYLIQTSVLINKFITPEKLYPGVIYRYKNLKGKCNHKRTEIYKYGTNGPPYQIALSDYPELKPTVT